MKKLEFERLIDFRDTAENARYELSDLLLLHKANAHHLSDEEIDIIRVTLGILQRIWKRTDKQIQKGFEEIYGKGAK